MTQLSRNQHQSRRRLEPLLKLEEASALLRRSHWTLRRDIKAGRLRCVRLGRRLLIERAEVRRLIAAGRY